MNILFLTLSRVESFQERGIYTDLLKCFQDNGHIVYVAAPIEKREKIETRVINCGRGRILQIRTGNVKKVNLIEKGISTLLLKRQYQTAIRKYFGDIRFDLILYSTPPITLWKVMKELKVKNHSKTYLLLKDIFPQNAVDLGILRKGGLLHKYFRKEEKKLYAVSDYIGCMSNANVSYLVEHNPEIPPEKAEVCPNSVRLDVMPQIKRKEICSKYHIPANKKIFLYGGNLGKPQGIDFILECLEDIRNLEQVYFLIVGSGTEFSKMEQYLECNRCGNVRLLSQLPKDEYDVLLSAADVGLIFLDKRFTIPNFPSRMLSYMQMEKPILAVTDKNTDIGRVILEGDMGDWCVSGDKEMFLKKLKSFCEMQDLIAKGKNAKEYLKTHYTVEHSYDIIMRHFEGVK